MRFRMMHERHAIKCSKYQIGVLWALWKLQNVAIPTVPAEQTEMWKALIHRFKAANVPKWAKRRQESIWESEGGVRCAQKMTRREGAGKESGSKGAEVQNMGRHVLRIALVLWLSGQHLNRPCSSGEATK
jgi:hypothetical protein